MKIGEALREATAAFEAAGCENPRLDAEVLLAKALGVRRTVLFTEQMADIAQAGEQVFRSYLERRRRREPVAYITGVKAFRRLELEVRPGVLIPRPETEHLVEAALGLPAGARVCDVGTGSGAVALALKQERPDLRVVATDISDAALAVAKANARFHELDVAFAKGSLLEMVEGDVDAVVSNPPYVREDERSALAPEISEHEPPEALFAGADGLDVIQPLIAATVDRGAKFLAIEVGAGQATVVRQLFRNAGFELNEVVADLAGIPRVVVGWR